MVVRFYHTEQGEDLLRVPLTAALLKALVTMLRTILKWMFFCFLKSINTSIGSRGGDVFAETFCKVDKLFFIDACLIHAKH